MEAILPTMLAAGWRGVRPSSSRQRLLSTKGANSVAGFSCREMSEKELAHGAKANLSGQGILAKHRMATEKADELERGVAALAVDHVPYKG